MLESLKTLETQAQSQSQLVHSHTQSIEKLETQMGQLDNMLNCRDEGKLPSQLLSI